MFEDLYRSAYKDVAPSDPLNEETLALMAEARDHRAGEPAPRLKWRPAYTAAIAGAAAVICVCVVTGAFFLHRGQVYEDELGTLPFLSGETYGDTQPPEQAPPETTSGTENQAQANGAGNSSASLPDSEDPSANAGQNAAGGGDSSQLPSGEIPPASSGSDSSGILNPSESIPPADPRDPVEINTTTQRTYYSISAFLSALDDKQTQGYGKTYYNARELIIVPSLLPDHANFRCFYLYSQTGQYSYSYWLTYEGADYILEITSAVQIPATAKEVTEQKEEIATEVSSYTQAGNVRTYLFGEKNQVSVLLKPADGDAVPSEALCNEILSQFALERCSLNNELIQLSYR